MYGYMTLSASIVSSDSMSVHDAVNLDDFERYILHHIQQSMDQPGKVANPARGQLNKEN